MSTNDIADFGCTKNELIEAVHAGANRDDVARIEGAVWRLFDRVSGLRYFMDARTSLLAELENEKRQLRAAAARLAELERENARMRAALQQISGTSSKLCPFTRGVPNNLQPTDPCPVCGDKGDFSDETTSKASRCVGNAPSAIARAALAGSGEK
jgi:hypothetical protein